MATAAEKWDSVMQFPLRDGSNFMAEDGAIFNLKGEVLECCENRQGGCKITGKLYSERCLPLVRGAVVFRYNDRILSREVRIVDSFFDVARNCCVSSVSWERKREKPDGNAYLDLDRDR